MTYGSGYYNYYNPYYVESYATVPAVDYSQPIVINTYTPVEVNAEGSAITESDPSAYNASYPETEASTAAYDTFDQARDQFFQGNYQGALASINQTLAARPQDPVVHEFRALAFFALGDYDQAAAVLNPLLAVAPGMDWATLRNLYPDTATYEGHLRALEQHIRDNPDDAGARFLIAYHYLVCGNSDAAVTQLRKVVELQPRDRVASQMLAGLTDDGSTDDQAPTPTEPMPTNVADDPSGGQTEETTDLVGDWVAERDGTQFTLTIDEQGQFAWDYETSDQGDGGEPISGNYSVDGNVLVLDAGGSQGQMAAQVVSEGADAFQFVLLGGPQDDPGLTFEREG